MRRYLKVLRIFALNSVQLELEYRGNFFLNILNSLIATGTGFLVLVAMFSNADAVGGWSFLEVLVLYGAFMVVEALMDVFLYPNLNRIPEYIRTGNMDFYLLKPISAQFMVSFRYLRVWMLPQLFIGFGVMGYGMGRLGQLTLLNVLSTLLLLVCGALIVYALWFALLTTAFWLVRVGNIGELFNAFFQAGRFPVSAFPTWARIFLTVIVPIAFVTTVPASAAVGRSSAQLVLGSVGVAFLLLALSHAFWRYAVANYTSASS